MQSGHSQFYHVINQFVDRFEHVTFQTISCSLISAEMVLKSDHENKQPKKTFQKYISLELHETPGSDHQTKS